MRRLIVATPRRTISSTPHLDDAIKIADKLGVTPRRRFSVSQRLNLGGDKVDLRFRGTTVSVSTRPRYQTGTMGSLQDDKMATFDSFYDSGRSFEDRYGNIVRGITDPTAF